MIAELSQKRLFVKRKIIVEDTKVIYRSTIFGTEKGVTVLYEDLTGYKEPHLIANNGAGILALVFLFFSLISLLSIWDKDFNPEGIIVWTPLFLIAALIYLITRQKVWKIRLQNYTYLFINMKSPTESKVDAFIDTLFAQRAEYLRGMYLYVNKNMPYETQFKNLQWLRKMEVIDAQEFEQWRKNLDTLFSTEKRSIGFFNN